MNILQQFGYFRKCETCKRKSFYVCKREIRLPTGDVAKSQKLMCKRCDRSINKAMKRQHGT